ncbi:hypothetical protein CLIM01_13426 [Colletotrichum limetticola]|uniref:Uncharacterized protein n=1 Tax=Colletotrichum limetticola TaxID=1209924 RepID=A0ABQ9PCD9_9PEZI|nr:hypothetical protein CLIM01_13426 [Colletotrichum limetticola]
MVSGALARRTSLSVIKYPTRQFALLRVLPSPGATTRDTVGRYLRHPNHLPPPSTSRF